MRVYKKRSTAEKYMFILTFSNSLLITRFYCFISVCFNQQQLRNIIFNICLFVFFCIVLVISRGLPFLPHVLVVVAVYFV